MLAKHDFTLTEEASANLLQASENKQVQVLLLAFDKELEEWEIRDLLCDHGTFARLALCAVSRSCAVVRARVRVRSL